MRAPPGYGQDYTPPDWSPPQQQPFRAPRGAIDVTAYSNIFAGQIASMNETPYGGAKDGEVCRTDPVNYLIGRAPDIQSLLQWAEARNLQTDPRPITMTGVGMLSTVNGVDPDVLGGHLWFSSI